MLIYLLLKTAADFDVLACKTLREAQERARDFPPEVAEIFELDVPVPVGSGQWPVADKNWPLPTAH